MDTKHKRCPYCGEEILAVAKKCRYCGEWLDADTEKSMTQKVDSIEPEEASTTVDREEKTSFWRKSWKVLSAILGNSVCWDKSRTERRGQRACERSSKSTNYKR